MDAALFTPNTAVQLGGSPPIGPETGGQQGLATGAGSDFGAIFSSIQPMLGRQDLAAVLFGQPPAIGPLVSVPLGSSMAVITPEGTPPSQDSLMAFARSQGLDETAIAALWQAPATSAEAMTQAILPALNSSQIPTPTLPLDMPDLAGGVKTMAGQPLPGNHSALLTPHAIVLGLTITPASGQKPEEATAATTELDAMALQSMRAQFLAQGQRGTGRNAAPAGHATEATVPPGMPTVRQDPPIIDLDLSQELARITQTTLAAASGEVAPSPSTAVTDARPPTAQTTAQDGRSAPSPSTPHTTLSGYQLKAEHYQQLADRMGQALAQRMLEQLGRGEWSMKLRLNPAELGQIDVRLEMRQAGLDAHFQAENPLTKELIQQGSGRLKDNLGQNGMTLASVSVSSDAERQSSGNPTPHHEQRRAAPEQQTAKPQAEPVREANLSKKTPTDGWDMLA